MNAHTSYSDVCRVCGAALDTSLTLSPTWTKDGYQIYRCQGCGVLFRHPLPEAHELSEIYSDEYFSQTGPDPDPRAYRDYLGEEEAHRRNARKRLKVAKDLLKVEAGRSFDVGTAAGVFVSEARSEGLDAQGCEISEAMAEYAMAHLGVSVENWTFHHYGPEYEEWDLVTMWDYLEQVIDPLAELRAATAMLKTGGVLGLSTGDVESLVARLSGARWHLLTPQHHNYYLSVDSLRRLGGRLGLEPIRVEHPAALYSIRYLCHKAGTAGFGQGPLSCLQSRSASRIGRALVPLNLRDIVVIWFRKS